MADAAALPAAPLAAFEGERPPAPAWFDRVMAVEPERLAVEVEGAQIEALAWGPRGAPGLVLLHGAGGHAGWWRFVAPLLAHSYRVAAFSLSGMGASDWRERYSMDTYADEAAAVAQAAGLFDAVAKPLVAGHSFGGRAVLRLAAREGERWRGAVVIDSIIRRLGEPRMKGGLWEPRPTRIYPTMAAALARFRLAPLQPCENLFLVDAVAREGIGPPRDGGEGFTWRFDPYLWPNLDGGPEVAADLAAARCPIALIYGARSRIMPAERVALVRQIAPSVPLTAIAEAEHHVMLDQPIALAAALEAHLALWPVEPRA